MCPTITVFSPSGGFAPSSLRSARTRPVYVPTISAGIPVNAGTIVARPKASSAVSRVRQ